MRSDTGAYRRRLHAVNGRSGRPGATLPSWARWNGELSQRYTLGVEEELMLLDPHSWSLVQSSDDVIARLSGELSAHVSPETHASVIELHDGRPRGRGRGRG